MKAIDAGVLGVILFKWILAAKPLALQNLQIPDGSTNRTILEWLFPRRFPTNQRLTASRPGTILITEISTKSINAPNAHPRRASRRWAGCKGNGEHSVTALELSFVKGPEL